MIFDRSLNLPELLSKNSFFLFGPRGVGKSHLVRHSLGEDALVINLLKSSHLTRLLHNPSELEEIIDAEPGKKKIVVIDEVQKVPALLDEVHRLIEERHIKFLLTGSSARRLKAGGANLLAGRAWLASLFPLTFHEIGGKDFNLEKYLRYGSLPAVWLSDDPAEQLDAYLQTYINEEVKAEGAIRKIPAFMDALRSAALSNGQLINFASIARDAGVSPPTVASYFQILEDTLIGFQLQPWKKPTSRKSVATAKFYFFDPGVVNAMTGTEHLERNSNLYGELFEQFIALELRAYLSYTRTKKNLYFWRTEERDEVDFIVDDLFAVEVKSTRHVQPKYLESLRLLREEKLLKNYIIVSQDTVDRDSGGILCLHWKSFLTRLWRHEFS
jgi:predicted AAA+ superfamily ATPase